MGADAGFLGQLVDAFLLDHGAVHIRQQHFLATVFGRLDDEVGRAFLEVVPHLPAVAGDGLHREFGGLVGGEPLRVAAAPRVAQAVDERGLKRTARGDQGGDVHGRPSVG